MTKHTELGIRRMAIGSLQELLQSSDALAAQSAADLQPLLTQQLAENGITDPKEIQLFLNYLVSSWNQIQGTDWQTNAINPQSGTP